MSKTREAQNLPVFQPRNWGKPSRGKPLPRPWWGLDTERDAKTGEFVCGWISNESQSHPFRTFTDLQPGVYWVWNVGYDLEAMMRDLGQEEGWAMRKDGSTFRVLDAQCVYYQGKRFEWRDHRGKLIFLEASSFFNRIGLKDAAKTLCECKCEGCTKHAKQPLVFQHCGRDEATCPMKDPVDASKMSLAKFKRDPTYRKTVDKYCAKDARIAYRLMTYLDRGFKSLSVDIGGTPGSTARRFLTNMPAFPKIIFQTHRPFLNAYCGGRFEIVKRGFFHDAKQYDIVSAYPWALAQCPMLTNHATQSFAKRMSDESLYGAYEISFKTDEYLGIAPAFRGNTRVYSKEQEKAWITKPELSWLQSNGYDYKIHRGVEVFDEAATDDWRKLVVPLFNKKDGHIDACPVYENDKCTCGKKLKGMPISLGAKVGVNSMYGILIQLIKKGGEWIDISELTEDMKAEDFAGSQVYVGGPKAFEGGQFYAPVYSASLTAMVRVGLLERAKPVLDDIVAFHTDSFLLKDGATMPEGSELGEVKLEKQADELIILKSGQYAIGEVVKGRGFSKRKLNPDDEDEIAIRHKEDLWASKQMRRSRVSVKTAKDWRDVSLIREREVANNVALEVKRDWHRGFDAKTLSRREWIDSDALRRVDG